MKDEIAKKITNRTSIESNLITKFPTEINQIYQKFKSNLLGSTNRS
jgi:hypothetical protein